MVHYSVDPNTLKPWVESKKKGQESFSKDKETETTKLVEANKLRDGSLERDKLLAEIDKAKPVSKPVHGKPLSAKKA